MTCSAPYRESDRADDFYGISVDRRGGAGPRLIPELLHGRSASCVIASIARLLRRLDLALGHTDSAGGLAAGASGARCHRFAGRAGSCPSG